MYHRFPLVVARDASDRRQPLLVRTCTPKDSSSYYGASPIPVGISLAAPARRTRHGNFWESPTDWTSLIPSFPDCATWQLPLTDCSSASLSGHCILASLWPSSPSVGAWRKLDALVVGQLLVATSPGGAPSISPLMTLLATFRPVNLSFPTILRTKTRVGRGSGVGKLLGHV